MSVYRDALEASLARIDNLERRLEQAQESRDVHAELESIPGRRIDHAFESTVPISPGGSYASDLFQVDQNGPFVLCAVGLRLVGAHLGEELVLLDHLTTCILDHGCQRTIGDFPGRLCTTFRFRDDADEPSSDVASAAVNRYRLPGYRLSKPQLLSPNTAFGVVSTVDAGFPGAAELQQIALGYRIECF